MYSTMALAAFPWMIDFITLAAFVMYFSTVGKSMGGNNQLGGLFQIGKSKAKLYNPKSAQKVTFRDVAGCEEVRSICLYHFLQPGKGRSGGIRQFPEAP